MKIGGINFPDPFVSLAPLAGYGDAAFRRLCRDFGASLTVTEMVSVKGLVYGNEKTSLLLTLAPAETPSCVQLFGSDPEFFGRALLLPALAKFDIIDINMGCPVPKVTKCGEGSALLSDPERASDIVRACTEASNGRPVTVKMRIGLDEEHIVAADFARKMQDAGAAALTVHGRTTRLGYAGFADWERIREVADAVSIPVIGNGDVNSREEAVSKIAQYGCAGVAIGRAALGHPWIFSRGSASERGTECDRGVVRKTVLRHLDYALEYLPEKVAVRTLRKHVCKYLAGLRATKELRLRVNTLTRAQELREAMSEL